jgi:hypothetical protein
MPAWSELPEISGVIFLAGIDKSGRLHPVGGLPLKLRAVARLRLLHLTQSSLPAISRMCRLSWSNPQAPCG